MEEQTIQQEQEQQQQPITNPETEQDYSTQNVQDSGTIPEDAPQTEEEHEIALTEDGELEFSNDFLGISDKNEEQKTDNANEKKTTPQPEKASTPNLYSPEELKSIPFERWDRGRLPAEIAAYYDAVQSQLTARQRVEQVRNAPMPNVLGEEPKPYTAKELVEAANKLAIERLGIKEEDFDPNYEEEHRAAVDLAKAELIQKRNYDVAVYKQRESEINELRNFNIGLANIPDFDGFSKWYDNALRTVGKTNEQVQSELIDIARNHGARAVMQIITDWYNAYSGHRQQNVNRLMGQSRQTPAPKAKVPPRLEGTQGGNNTNGKTYNMREFGQLDDDAQAQALMDMGIV